MAGVFADVNHGDWVSGVGGVRAAGDGVDHQFGVAVVGGDEPASVALLDGLVDAAELGVDGFAGLDGGLKPAGVADHVSVGEVGDDQIESRVFNGLDDGVADGLGLHLRREIIGGYLEGWDGRAVFAGEGNVDAAVEEVGNVRELFGLGYAQVAKVVRGENVGEDVVHRLGRDDEGERVELVVLRHADIVQVLRDLAARDDFIERFPRIEVAAAVLVDAALAGEHAGDLTGAVGAEVEVEAYVFIADRSDRLAGSVDHNEGNEELVGDAVVVVFLNARDWIEVGATLGLAGDHGVEGLALALPALVAVHGVVAAIDGGDFAHSVLAHLLLKGG